MTKAPRIPQAIGFALRHASGLSPFGPIFGKELRITARRRRSYVLRVFYLAALLLALLVAWSSTSRGYYGSIAAQAQAQAELGSMFFVCFTMFSVVAMAAIGPVLTSTAIGSERLAKTLHVLLMTPITAWQVVAGKLFSRLLVALTLLGLSLPVLALVRLLGGVELWQMIGAVCVCAVTALTTAAIGLLFSTFMNRAYAVILLSYATILLLYAFIPFVLIEGLGLRAMAWFRIFATVNPFMSAGMLADPGAFMASGNAWVHCVALHLAFTAVLLVICALVLRRVVRKAGGEAGPAVPDALVAGAAVPAPEAMAAEGMGDAKRSAAPPPVTLAYADRTTPRPPRARPGDVTDQPVLWRELRRPLLARRWQSVVAASLSLLLLVITYAVIGSEGDLDDEDAHRGYAVIFNGLLWLLTAVLAATAIAQEKESDTWTLLLTTPLSGQAIVWGKVGGLYRRFLWPGVLFAGHLLLFSLTDVIDLIGALLCIWVMFSFNSIWVATGVYLSLRLQKVTFAVIANLVLAVFAYLGVFAVLIVVSQTGRYGNNDLPEVVGWYLPYFYLVNGISGGWPFWSGGHLEMPGGMRVGYAGFVFIAGLVGIAHLLVASAILWATGQAFDRMVGRARQFRGPPGFPILHQPVAGAAS